jgi:predicted nucleic-acid-binding Zn-ribbon protein
MKRTGKCPKCQSAAVITDAMVVDHAHLNTQREMTVATFRNPSALIFKGQVSSTVSAWVCAECGYLEFYADTPEKLKFSQGPQKGA